MNGLRYFVCLLVVAVSAGCGSDESDNNVTYITTDDMSADAANGNDATSDASEDEPDADAGSVVEETPRPDMELILEREITFTAGDGGRLAFDVPDDAVSVTVSVIGEKAETYTLLEWTNGDETDLVPRSWINSDQGAPALCISCPVRVSSSAGAFAAMTPNNETATLIPGRHTVSAYGYRLMGFGVTPLDGTTATLKVHAKRLPEPPQTGVLDVNFHLTGARGWYAENAADDPDLQAIITRLGELYEPVDITLGTITYTDIGEEWQIVENVFLANKMMDLFALSADQPRHAINVFLVDELFLGSGPGLGVLLGVSGGIPGPPEAGTFRSGVVINTRGDAALPMPTANVIAHEVGHHLGLFHTSESMQPIHDPIADTPENDQSMLMHATSSTGVTISETQGMVMRHNLWVHHPQEQ